MTAASKPVPLLCSLPGAGVLVFWQLGVIKGLASRYNLHDVPMLGSSSGALVCAMAKSGACLDQATDRGLELLKEFGVVNRSWGLVGILGRLTRQWMKDVLPENAGERCSSGAASMLITTLPLLRHHTITDYKNKSDLMDCVMASSHIPVVCDMRLWVLCRWRPCLDGGLWWLIRRSEAEYKPTYAANTMLITPFEDEKVLKDLHILRKLRPQDLNAMHALEQMGEEHAAVIAAQHHQLLHTYTRPHVTTPDTTTPLSNPQDLS